MEKYIKTKGKDGSDYAVAVYRSEDGREVDKKIASKVILTTYKKDGTPVGRYYCDLTESRRKR